MTESLPPRFPAARKLRRRAVLALFPAVASAAIAGQPSQPVRLDDPPAGKALIVFFRKWEYFGVAVSYIVREGHAEIGRLSAGTYFVAVVDPGLHTYTVHAERHNDMQIVAEAGEIYYVRYAMDVGIVLYQPTLEPTEQREFDQASAHLKLSPPLTHSDAPPAVTTP